MNVATVMAEMATVLGGISGLRVHDKTSRVVYPPSMLIPLPTIGFDETYRRGMDVHTYDLTLLAGPWTVESSVAAMGDYTAGAGAKSVKAALEAHTWAACQQLNVTGVEFATVTVAGTEYLGAVFETVARGAGS